MWQVCKNRLATKDKLNWWDIETDGWYLLYAHEPESIEYLFFKCGFSAYVWSGIQHCCLIYRGVYAWKEELDS